MNDEQVMAFNYNPDSSMYIKIEIRMRTNLLSALPEISMMETATFKF